MFDDKNSPVFETEDMVHEVDGFKPADEVKSYSQSSTLQYPNIIISFDDIQAYIVDALTAIMSPKTLITSNETYALYVQTPEGMAQIGVVDVKNISRLVKGAVFRKFYKEINISPNEKYTGDMLYAVCQVRM